MPAATGPAGAFGIADAAGQPHTQTRPWYRKTWAVAAGGLTALLVGAAIAISITVTLTTGSTSSPSATAMRQWWSRASLHFQQSANALAAIQSAANADDIAGVAAACQQLHDADAAGLQADLPTPDPDLTIAVQDMIDDAQTAAHICISIGPTSSTDEINQLRSYFAHAGAHLQTANEIMKRDGLPAAPTA